MWRKIIGSVVGNGERHCRPLSVQQQAHRVPVVPRARRDVWHRTTPRTPTTHSSRGHATLAHIISTRAPSPRATVGCTTPLGAPTIPGPPPDHIHIHGHTQRLTPIHNTKMPAYAHRLPHSCTRRTQNNTSRTPFPRATVGAQHLWYPRKIQQRRRTTSTHTRAITPPGPRRTSHSDDRRGNTPPAP